MINIVINKLSQGQPKAEYIGPRIWGLIKKMVKLLFSNSFTLIVHIINAPLAVKVNANRLIFARRFGLCAGFLTWTIKSCWISDKKAKEDADLLKTAIDTASRSITSIIAGEDVDLLNFITQLSPTDKNILLLKPGKYIVSEQWFEAKSFAHTKLKSIIMLRHAFCGCANTSCFYGTACRHRWELASKRAGRESNAAASAQITRRCWDGEERGIPFVRNLSSRDGTWTLWDSPRAEPDFTVAICTFTE